MVVLCRWVLVWALLLAGGLRLLAVSAEETAFQVALRELRGNSWARADAQFGAFIASHTNSSHLSEAILYQAEARLKLGQPAGAMALLLARLPQAGKATDCYLFYLGEAFAQSGDYRKACDTFGKLLQQFPNSTNALNAAVEQATACSRLGEWPQVIALLQPTNGLFQTAVRSRPTDESTQRGLLLLGEAWLRADAPQRFASAEAALQPLAHLPLAPDMDWPRQELLCRILLGSGRTNEALQNTTNLLAAATQAGAREWLARSYEFRAGVLEGLGRLTNAIDAYTNNLADGVPDEPQRRALLQSTKLLLRQDRITNALQNLEKFVLQYSNAPAADMALLTLGELHLGQLAGGLNANGLDTLPAGAPDPTNAILHLQAVVQRFPQSPLAAKAQLDLGWCFWLQGQRAAEQANLPAAKTAFQAAEAAFQAAVGATNTLPLDQATAGFKLADTQFRQGQLVEAQAGQDFFRRALTNYSLVRDQALAQPALGQALLEPALYQIVKVSLAAGDVSAATNAMGQLLAQFPDGSHVPTAAAVLLTGQALGQRGNPQGARALFQDFAARATNAALLPEVHLAIARTWEEEGDWTNALQQYCQVLSCCTNPAVRAEAAFYQAQATWRAGDWSNALVFHTNFVAHFATHSNAPIAQSWVGDYYFNQGNFSAAELNYQQLFESTNWRSSPLVYRARMMAGRAAFRQALWNNAVTHFTNLTANVNFCPSNLWVEAMFAYGDCHLSQLSKERGDTNNLEHLRQAVDIFTEIYKTRPTDPKALLALGRKADTLVQLAQHSGDTLYYTNALATYQQLTNTTIPDVSVRSMAKMGLYVALKWQAEQKSGAEQTALLRQALDQCLDVVRGAILLPGEKGDPYWTWFAGEKGLDLAVSLQAWDEAQGLCQELGDLFSAQRTRYQERAAALKTRQSSLSRN